MVEVVETMGEIPKEFRSSVGSVGSRLPCFPYSVTSMACFSRQCWINRYAATSVICAFATRCEWVPIAYQWVH